jgi:hypothetical protein
METPEMPSSVIQSIAAVFVALADASGTLPKARQILADALDDGVISDPVARCIIEACAESEVR